MSDNRIPDNANVQEHSSEDATETNGKMTRRKLLASLGIAGAAIAFSGPAALGKAASHASVTGAVYGEPVWEPACLESIADMLSIVNPEECACVYVKSYSAGNHVGGGMFAWNAASTATDNGVTVFSPPGISTGRWVRAEDEVITPYHAGAVDNTNASDALDRFADFVKTDNGKTQIRVVGNFTISRPLDFDCTGQASIHWDLKLKALNAMRYMLALRGSKVVSSGAIEVVGTGTIGTFSAMTVEYGVVLNGVQSSKLPKIKTSLMKYFGIVMDENGLIGIPVQSPAYHNNTCAEIDSILARDCGCSQIAPWSNNNTSYTYSNPVHTGTSGTANQRTTITVSGLPYDSNLITNPVFAVINGITYKVEATDFTNKTVALFPWIETAEPTSGAIKFIFGGALFSVGPNAGPTKVGLIDAIRCGMGVLDAALYGVNVTSITTQFCGIGSVVGYSGSSVSPQTSAYIGFYTEAVYRNILFIGSGSCQILNRYGSLNGEPFINCERIAPNNRTGDYGAFADTIGWKRFYMPNSLDNMLDGAYYKGKSRNQDLVGASISISPTGVVPRLYKKNSWTINLLNAETANKYKGVDDAMIGFIGTGTNGAPSGAFTFNPPSGWKVNGTSSASFSGFGGPAVFLCYWEIAAKNIMVSLLSQKAAAQNDSTAGDIATLKDDFNALLLKLRNAGLMS
ncbi:hypothetical protein PAECIP111891_03679 [Paenibacillus allorhizoplanae]|uniref:Uncharacterized protein n=1 Tax=Paenibacillus allorhizoplanae TaxID=2905648 RepID=A0ABM9CF64_9BACL|nr:hypothetical protein [Paenibacillus allorhizoplanae]CAH1211082.1 hypothetical protein PAECIP111891_03679 [Paenibacillus allorhizoplanae]